MGEAGGDENGDPSPKKGRRGRKRKMQSRRDDDDDDDDDNTGTLNFILILRLSLCMCFVFCTFHSSTINTTTSTVLHVGSHVRHENRHASLSAHFFLLRILILSEALPGFQSKTA